MSDTNNSEQKATNPSELANAEAQKNIDLESGKDSKNNESEVEINVDSLTPKKVETSPVDEETRKEKAKESTQRGQVANALTKIALGETTLEDQPEWIQNKIKETKISNPQIDYHSLKAELKKEVKEETLNEISSNQKFQQLKQQLEGIKIPKSKSDILQKSFDSLSKNLPLDEALELSLLKAGISNSFQKAENAGANKVRLGGVPLGDTKGIVPKTPPKTEQEKLEDRLGTDLPPFFQKLKKKAQ